MSQCHGAGADVVCCKTRGGSGLLSPASTCRLCLRQTSPFVKLVWVAACALQMGLCMVAAAEPLGPVSSSWRASGVTAAEVEQRRHRHLVELKAYAAQRVPRDAATAHESIRRHRRRAKPPVRQEPPLWPGIIAESSRWLDKSKAERNALRQEQRARQGIGRGGMWLDDQDPLDQLVDDWLATREMLGLTYDGDVTKEPEVPRRPTKIEKKFFKAFQDSVNKGEWDWRHLNQDPDS